MSEILAHLQDYLIQIKVNLYFLFYSYFIDTVNTNPGTGIFGNSSTGIGSSGLFGNTQSTPATGLFGAQNQNTFNNSNK